MARPKSARADDLRTPTEARWAQFSKFRSVDLLNLRPHHRARKLAANPAPFYTAWVKSGRPGMSLSAAAFARSGHRSPHPHDLASAAGKRMMHQRHREPDGRPSAGLPQSNVGAMRGAHDWWSHFCAQPPTAIRRSLRYPIHRHRFGPSSRIRASAKSARCQPASPSKVDRTDEAALRRRK